jgi:multicomponent Na+:H+ antiporter subunit D
VSKWYLLSSTLGAQQYGALALIVASTLLNASYLLPIVYAAFFQPDKDPVLAQHGEAPWPMLLALALTAGASVALFFFAGVPLRLAAALAGG